MHRTLIHNTPGYQLSYRVTTQSPVGTTLELFQKMPKAARPRWQRFACLTLPPESFRCLSEVFADAATLPGPSWGRS